MSISYSFPIEASSVSFKYETQWVLLNVSFQIPAQTITCIVGPNGGGKTTLLKICLGLLKPQSGTVRVLGQMPEKTRIQIGYTPQHSLYDHLFPITVEEVVAMGRLSSNHLFKRISKQDRAAVLQALDQVHLTDSLKKPFQSLSGGQRQRVLIARALACEPQILCLDEPTANVDPKVEDQLLTTLNQLKSSMTIVLVSHDLGFVASVVDQVLCVNQTLQLHPKSALSSSLIDSLYGHHVHGICHDACS